ncbi:unnamed protein product, partial [marine sediment metagenome]
FMSLILSLAGWLASYLVVVVARLLAFIVVGCRFLQLPTQMGV